MDPLIRDVMTRDVEVLRPTDTLRAAAQKMQALDMGPLPVCDGGRLQGMLTDRDIVVRAVAEGKDPATTRVCEAMSPGVSYCFDDESPEDVLERMQEQQLRHFVVVDRDKRLVGLVALADLAGVLGARRVGQAVQGLSEPASAPHGWA